MKTADLLEAGNVWINQYFKLNSGAPFGGVKVTWMNRKFRSSIGTSPFNAAPCIALQIGGWVRRDHQPA
ncbi:aldehyde dehydrogenase family protein [Pseudomonas taiwanensis]|uniref:aldehyde dehydrogenase family protein n=1 Tax=Pseudomonas taiwanensis TaxID=470150 RepID=UPI001646729A|nr:aldehyde dehydrogenase family protein [Pseudomonas taiwanensis]